MQIIKGDLIKLALEGNFDIIAHGCNCFCTQGAGIAKQMATTFKTDDSEEYFLEREYRRGDMTKLGNIESTISTKFVYEGEYRSNYIRDYYLKGRRLAVYNMYTQYNPGKDLNYSALEICLMKLNYSAKKIKDLLRRDVEIGLPWVGCGIAGGEIELVEEIMKKTITDANLTVVEYDGQTRK